MPEPITPEVSRNGLATKTGMGGSASLVAVAVTDAIVTGHIDSDAYHAAVGAVVLAGIVMLGKYGQAIADIIGKRLEAAAAAKPTRTSVQLDGREVVEAVAAAERAAKARR